VVLNQYLREYRDKISSHRANLERVSTSGTASAREKSQALKEIEDISKILAELKEYEDEVLFPLASKQIEIGLDDGVKVNHAKFGDALKKI
jgi:phosphoglycerate-specific signal transduction histidine kinase